jgi:hypothetical protein
VGEKLRSETQAAATTAHATACAIRDTDMEEAYQKIRALLGH